MTPIASSTPPLWLSIVAGGLAGGIEVATLGHLLDRLKVQQEAFLDKRIFTVWRREALYKGLRWNLLLGVSRGSMGWATHNVCNRMALIFFPEQDVRFPSFYFTSAVGIAVAALETSLFICPLERLKIIEMTDQKGIPFRISNLVQKEGKFFIYQGWTRTVLRQSVSWLSYLSAYRVLRQSYLDSRSSPPSLSFTQKMGIGTAIGAFAAFMSTPFDLLKTQAQRADAIQENIGKTFDRIVKQHGWRGLYYGLSMKMLRSMWSSVVTLLVFDHLNAFPKNMALS
jgi:hypothetical protein